jgi:hypothetical protein
MQTRRQLLIGAVAGAVSAAFLPLGARAEAKSTRLRPAVERRTFTSPAVEATLARVKATIADAELAWLFENCYPNSLDTTVTMGEHEGKPDTFIVTGDIAAMWLRDSSAQVWPYLPLAKTDVALRRLFQGLIHRHARCVLLDPYANAFSRDLTAKAPLSWAAEDMTDMHAGVAERKWEVDSLCYPVRLAHGYWRVTGDRTPFDAQWREAAILLVKTLRAQQRKEGPGPYHFQRVTETPTDTLGGSGYGAPTRKVGLIHSMFRPSDDACTYPFLIPSNLFAVQSLRQLATMARAIHEDETFAAECESFATEVERAVLAYGRLRNERGESFFAYEVDGFGNASFMDDANIPGLSSLAYLGCVDRNDPVYRETRARCWSTDNPYFFAGTAAEGIGGPHVGLKMIWPLSIMVRALTSDDDAEIRRCLTWLKTTHAGTGFMHEAFDQDDASRFTRPWFAWANSLFGELILDLHMRKPAILRNALS